MSKSSNSSSDFSIFSKSPENLKVDSNEIIIKIKELNTDLIYPNNKNYTNESQGGHKIVVIGKPGTGKCFAHGTEILMYNGEIKQVQNIVAGDILMGDDSNPRNVLNICVGKESMYKVIQSNGMDYIVNSPHILCLKDVSTNNLIKEITVLDYLNLTDLEKLNLKGYKVDVEFEYNKVNIHPYILGFCHKLSKKISLNKSIIETKNDIYDYLQKLIVNFRINIQDLDSYISKIYNEFYDSNNYLFAYKFNTKNVRLDYISGILDSYNILPYLVDNKYCYKLDFNVTDDDVFIFQSLGLKIVKNEDCTLLYGHNLNLLNRKLKFDKITFDYLNNLSDIQVSLESLEDYYYGFQIDGNGRFLLSDFTVTHNTNLIASLMYAKKDIIPVACIMSGTEDSNYYYRKIFPSIFVHNSYEEEQVEKYIKRQKIAKKHLANPWSILLLDDCTDKPALFKKPLQQNLYKNGRHYKMLYILSLQYCMDVLPVIRTNVDGVFIMRESNIKNRHSLYENYAGIIPDFNLFCEILDQITNDFTALYIHNATTTNDWKECVFWYKAVEIDKKYPDFKFGCPDFWKFSEDRYNTDYTDPI